MRIYDPQCCHMTNPLGYGLDKAVLSWKVCGAKGKKEASAQIEVALDPYFNDIYYDSGPSDSIDSLAWELPLTLEPRTRYYWRVSVYDETGDKGVSEVAWFETSIKEMPASADWIGADIQEPAPLIRKKFDLERQPGNARLYIGAIGQFDLYVNGEQPEQERFAPGCCDLDDWIPINTYDVTHLLHAGENIIAIMQGEGWSKMSPLLLAPEDGRYGDKGCAVICALYGEMDDAVPLIVSDTSWKTTAGYLLKSSIYDGEVLDLRRLPEEWKTASFDDDCWGQVSCKDYDRRKLAARYSLPIRVQETIRPVGWIETPAGEHVLDMGQNMVGNLQIRLNLPYGEELLLQFGEALEDGNFYNGNLMDALQEFRCISDGQPHTVCQHFTYYGFRYVRITGWRPEMTLDDFTGLVIYSNVSFHGSIETSDPMLNKLFENARWSQKGNFLGNPTDDTQRSERLGWTGDAQIFCGTANYNADCYAFYRKYLKDLRAEQARFHGSIPYTVPAFRMRQHGSAAWGDVATILPWTLYLFYGDTSILRESFQSMREWVDYMGRGSENGLCTCGLHFGDHMAIDRTDSDYLANAYYYQSCTICAKTARLLGFAEEAESYEQKAVSILEAIRKEYVTPNGRLAIDSQTASVYALQMDLVPTEKRSRVCDAMDAQLQRSGHHLTTGFLGTPFLCRVLSENGRNEIAYELLLNREYPGWMYPITKGATTMWECWNGIDQHGTVNGSLNHYAYGAVVEWMYRCMAGIQPDEAHPGFRRFRLAPQPNHRVGSVSAKVDTASGTITSTWTVKDNALNFYFEIPFHCTAEIVLPDAKIDKMYINGIPASKFDCQQKGSQVSLQAETGCYSISYCPERSYENVCGPWMTVRELMEREDTAAIMEKYFNKRSFGAPDTVLGMLCKTPDKSITSIVCETMTPLFRAEEIAAFASELAQIRWHPGGTFGTNRCFDGSIPLASHTERNGQI